MPNAAVLDFWLNAWGGPQIAPAGGSATGGAAVLAVTPALVPAGGPATGGAAHLAPLVLAPAGGPVSGGAATLGVRHPLAPSGGTTSGGRTPLYVAPPLFVAPAGGSTTGGHAILLATPPLTFVPAGGSASGGRAALHVTLHLAPRGGSVTGMVGPAWGLVDYRSGRVTTYGVDGVAPPNPVGQQRRITSVADSGPRRTSLPRRSTTTTEGI